MEWWLNVIGNILQIVTSFSFFVVVFKWGRNVMKEHNIGSNVLIAVLCLSILISAASLAEKIGWWPSNKPEQVFNRHFKDETVILDNHEYFNCTFENAKIKYGGGYFVLNNVEFIMPIELQATTLGLTREMELLKLLGWLNPAAGLSLTVTPPEP